MTREAPDEREQDCRSVAAGSGAGDGGFDGSMMLARLHSRSYRPGPDGAAFLHNAAGFVKEHRRHAQRWDLAAIGRDLNGTVALYVGGSDEDAYEHRQIPATRECVPQAEVLTFPGHPDLAATIRDIAARHGGHRSPMT